MENFITRIKPPAGFALGLRELWQHRELFYFFAWRDIKVKYKQATLGLLWAVLQPLGMMLLFTLTFSKILNVSTASINYPIFVLAGLVLWQFFYNMVSNGAESIIRHEKMINKIYFPRLIIPGAAALTAFFDFIIGVVIFFVFCIVFQQPVSLSALIYYPFALLILVFAGFGAGCLLSALTAKFKDFRYTISFLLQLVFFSSQVIYPLHSVSNNIIKYIFFINPVNAAIELFRKPLSAEYPIHWDMIAIGAASALFLFIAGIYLFKKTERYFADLV